MLIDAVNDNIIPLLSQIVLDLFLRHGMTHRPRALLEGFQPKDKEELKQLSIMHSIVPTIFTLQSANKMCFHTVIWGNGMKIIYTHLLIALRRLIADLLREVINIAYHPPNPFSTNPFITRQKEKVVDHNVKIRKSNNGDEATESFALSRLNHPLQSKTTISVHCTFHASEKRSEQASVVLLGSHMGCSKERRQPMNIVIFTRGSSGLGRSMAKEQLLQDKLIELGHS